jgi:ribonuclease P protein component
VSKAVGNAVVRNRTKRRLRASVATRLSDIPAGLDLVVRANPAAADATYGELDSALERQLARVSEQVGAR